MGPAVDLDTVVLLTELAEYTGSFRLKIMISRADFVSRYSLSSHI